MEKNDVEFTYYIVAFMDILGQQDKLKNIVKLPCKENKEECKHFIEIIKNSFGIVESFCVRFHSFFNKYKTRSLTDKLNSEGQEIYKKLESQEIRIKRIGDCVIIFMSLKESEDKKLSISGVYGVLCACATMFLLDLSIGRPVRGGIDIGVGSIMSDGELYGPVIANAYKLENKIAQYPRVVVGNGLIEYLKTMENTAENNIFDKFRKSLSSLCQELITQDIDGQFIVDYLGKGFKNIIATNFLPDTPFKAHKYIVEQANKFRVDRDSKHAFRYNLLINYFEDRLKKYWQ